jgi:hypothetical protein
MMCGVDSTVQYNNFHGDDPQWLFEEHGIDFLGILGEAGLYTTDDVAVHDQQSNCWSIVYGNVFDLTTYGK